MNRLQILSCGFSLRVYKQDISPVQLCIFVALVVLKLYLHLDGKVSTNCILCLWSTVVPDGEDDPQPRLVCRCG